MTELNIPNLLINKIVINGYCSSRFGHSSGLNVTQKAVKTFIEKLYEQHTRLLNALMVRPLKDHLN